MTPSVSKAEFKAWQGGKTRWVNRKGRQLLERTVTPLASLRAAWRIASEEERSVFLNEI